MQDAPEACCQGALWCSPPIGQVGTARPYRSGTCMAPSNNCMREAHVRVVACSLCDSFSHPRRRRSSSDTDLSFHQRRRLLPRTASLDRCQNPYRIRCSNAVTVPQTSPARTKALWRLVQDQKDAVMPLDEVQNLRGSESLRSRATMPRRTRGSSRSLTSKTSSEQSTAQSSVTSSKNRRISPYDRDFRARALDPCAITIEKSPSVKAYIHFGVHEPVGSRVEYYTQRRGAGGSRVWLEENIVKDVQREYECMQRGHLCEAEFASYAKETIFKRDPRIVELSAEARCWKTERTIELVAKVDSGSFWNAPPVLNQSNLEQGYAFDLRPRLCLLAITTSFQPRVCDTGPGVDFCGEPADHLPLFHHRI